MPRTSRRFAAAEAPAPAGYTPPANPEAEQSVLGAILVRPEVMDRIADLIVPEDFYREAHGRIYQAMLDLYGKGEPVDLVTVNALLKERGQLEGVGGPVFLAGLSEQVGFATNAEYYANLVQDKAVLRRLLDCTQEIASGCLAPVENVAEFLDDAEHKIFQVAEAKVRPGFSPLSALVDTEIATLEAIWGRKDGSLTGVTSGFTDLDNYTAGFQASDLIILAARPSMGKTALALNIAFNAAYARTLDSPCRRCRWPSSPWKCPRSNWCAACSAARAGWTPPRFAGPPFSPARNGPSSRKPRAFSWIAPSISTIPRRPPSWTSGPNPAASRPTASWG